MHNDIGRERMELAERGLVDLLSYEVDKDMRQFVESQGGRSDTSASLAASDERVRPTPANTDGLSQVTPADVGETRSASGPRLTRSTCQPFRFTR
jgi:hypothetical protein